MTHYQRVADVMRRRSGTVTAVATLLLLGALVIVLGGRWGQFATAIATAPWWTLTIAAVLHIGSLVARSEAWNVCVRAAGGTVGRREIYRAASFGYVGNLVNGQFGFAMRIAALRRSAPRETPKALALATTEVPILIIEATLAALTSFTLSGPLGWPWWAPVAACGVMLALMEGLRRLSHRYQRGWGQGLAVLRDAPGRWRIIALVVLAICAQITRNWLLLQACGVNASVLDATAVLIAVAVLSPLPLGPGVGASAAVLILGTNGVAAVAAAGVLLTATGAAGALGYAGWAITDRLWSAHTRLNLSRTTTPSLSHSRLEASK